MKRRLCKGKAFTLVELIVVIAILAILAAIATTAGLGIARSVRNNRNKTAVQNYFTAAKGVMAQVNGGTTVYGMNPTSEQLAELMKRVGSAAPVNSKRLILADSEGYSVVQPNTLDTPGFYVAVRHADPNILEYNASTKVDEKKREWFVEAVFYVQDDNMYYMTRYDATIGMESGE